MIDTAITSEQVLAVMRDPKHAGRKLWTASVVLDRMGAFRRFGAYSRYSRADRVRVKRILEALCREGRIEVVKERHTLHSVTGAPEVAYGLPDPLTEGEDR